MKTPESIKNTLKYSYARQAKEFYPFIESIVFPSYKNLLEGSELVFECPITLLIGKNGTNKSSILNALYGAPVNKSTGEYWFATHTDPISGHVPSFFYRYTIKQTGKLAEVLKMRIGIKDPDYWEPSRPIEYMGMKIYKDIPKSELEPGQQQTRWSPISKPVVYLDFRAEISAFDKAFFSANKDARLKNRSRLRRRSKWLKQAIDQSLHSKIYHTKERIKKNELFDEKKRIVVSEILGVEYEEVRYLEHDFYNSDSFSIYLKRANQKKYSEAFAGSGEASIVRMISAIEDAKHHSLVLIDEPETSLHIDAQKRLMEYLARQTIQKKFQLVISTHSPFFLECLPSEAIKVLFLNEENSKIQIINEAVAEEGSFYLGQKRHLSEKITLYVEDSVSEAVVQFVCSKRLTNAQRDRIEIAHIAGGAPTMYDMAAIQMSLARSSCYFLFDGDQKYFSEIPDPATISPDKIVNTLQEIFNHSPRIPFDGKTEPAEKDSYYRKYISFAREHFIYLPFKTPEFFLGDRCPEIIHDDLTTDGKDEIEDYVKKCIGDSGPVKSSDITLVCRIIVAQLVEPVDEFSVIENLIKKYILKCIN